jgi:hypothetical protein
MAEPDPRYSFDPLERRGVLLGLHPVQLVTLAVAASVAFAAGKELGSARGMPIAVTLFAGIAATAIWTRGGRPLCSWFSEAAAWTMRRARGPALDDRPLAGMSTAASQALVARRRGTTGPAGIELVAIEGHAGDPSLGVVVDRRQGTWAAVMPVRGRSFSLLDPHEQARRLEGWRVVLNSLGRPGTAVRRVQWVERSFPADNRTDHALGDGSTAAAESYEDLVSAAKPSQQHETCLVVAVEGPPSAVSPSRPRAAQVLRRELRLLEGQLRNADLLPSAPLQPEDLALAVAGGSGGGLWPSAEDEQWSHLRSGPLWHSTYWIADWPRVDVRPDFLTPLLMGEGRRTVSLVMEPVPPDRAARDVRAARTADAADEQLRARAGFLPSARRGREAEGVARREEELADGHAEFRFSGYVTVHAQDLESLDVGCAEAEHAAQASHLELRRLYGRQREAFSWTLPLARGLR